MFNKFNPFNLCASSGNKINNNKTDKKTTNNNSNGGDSVNIDKIEEDEIEISTDLNMDQFDDSRRRSHNNFKKIEEVKVRRR